jgi:type I restriction enzyme S subunit
LKSQHFVDDGDVYVIESNFATSEKLNLSELKRISSDHFESIKRSEVRSGDIVIAKIGARYGMCSILPELDKPAVVSGNSMKLTINNECCETKFAVYVLRYLKERGAIEDIVNMTAQPALSLGEMNNLPFPLPGLPEQAEIVEELGKKLGEFDALISECTNLISLSAERRSALVSAAVTGKIDVRNWQPPADTNKKSARQEAAHG